MAGRLSRDAAAKAGQTREGRKIDGATEASEIQKAEKSDGAITLGQGSVKFLELDAETMGEYFSSSHSKESNGEGKRFDVVWISEALSHFPDKPLFFQNAFSVLAQGGKLVIADWFKAEGLGREEVEGDIKPIEGMYAISHSSKFPGPDRHINRRHAPSPPQHPLRLHPNGTTSRLRDLL